jgi:gamma-glutamylcysteine synthetase
MFCLILIEYANSIGKYKKKLKNILATKSEKYVILGGFIM